MRSYAAAIVVVIVMTLGNVAHTGAYSMEEMCSWWSGAGYIGNPGNCQGWGYCKSQELVAWGSCKTGLVYNPQTATCDYNTDSPCTTSAVQSCLTLTSEAIIPDPNNCTQYAYCQGVTGSSPEYGSCPTGQKFDNSQTSCVWGPSCPQDGICAFMKTNIFVGNPDNCTQFIQCLDGQSTVGSCSNNNYYNYETGYCQSTYPSVCGSGSGGGTTAPSKNTTICKTQGSGFVDDDLTCNGFYGCDSDYVGTWGSCDEGTHFQVNSSDTTKAYCVSPVSISCPYDRCQNLDLAFVTVIDSECKQYTYCPTGYVGQCPDTYPYFDEINQVCIRTQPTYPICTGTSSDTATTTATDSDSTTVESTTTEATTTA